jgi:hypothetical protein
VDAGSVKSKTAWYVQQQLGENYEKRNKAKETRVQILWEITEAICVGICLLSLRQVLSGGVMSLKYIDLGYYAFLFGFSVIVFSSVGLAIVFLIGGETPIPWPVGYLPGIGFFISAWGFMNLMSGGNVRGIS